jgi:hypothetical protein
MKYLVKGDHPIFGRPDKIFEDYDKAVKYKDVLLDTGFCNVELKIIEEEENDEEVREMINYFISEMNRKVIDILKLTGEDLETVEKYIESMVNKTPWFQSNMEVIDAVLEYIHVTGNFPKHDGFKTLEEINDFLSDKEDE